MRLFLLSIVVCITGFCAILLAFGLILALRCFPGSIHWVGWASQR